MNIDDCGDRKCNGGECVDGVQTAFCRCPAGKMGPACDKSMFINNCLSTCHVCFSQGSCHVNVSVHW